MYIYVDIENTMNSGVCVVDIDRCCVCMMGLDDSNNDIIV